MQVHHALANNKAVDMSALKLSVAAVTERDIDLLLLEEFVASDRFCAWFTERIGWLPGKSAKQLIEAKRSVTQSLGESDLEVTFLYRGKRQRILVENKIGAGFQPRQASRYAEKARMYTRRKDCYSCTTVLIAPAAYFGKRDSAKGFAHRLSYEDILNWFITSQQSDPRNLYKSELLSAAIKKSTYGHQPDADRPVSDFWHDYWSVVEERAPELGMTEPSAKGARAGFVWFFPPTLSKRWDDSIAIVHKFPHGNVDLQFARAGAHVEDIRTITHGQLPRDTTVVKAKASASLRMAVPVLNTGYSFASQRDLALQGILAAKAWHRWTTKHPKMLAKIVALVG